MWDGIHFNGKTPLCVIQGSLTGLRYRGEIVRPLIQPALQAVGPGVTLQDDYATPHRLPAAAGIPRTDLSACSPDLAPTEHVWDGLGRRMAEKHPPPVDVNRPTRFLQQEWQNISQQTLRNIVFSTHRCCNEWLAANCSHTCS